MADAPRKIYWDTGCFICFLNRSELDRRAICEDILLHARDGDVIIYTSTLTISEVVYPKRPSLSNPRKLSEDQISKISNMFRWRWLRKVDVDQRVAHKAVELSRDFGLLPSDAIHAATEILQRVDALQCWDRDFKAISHLIPIESPQMISDQAALPNMPPMLGPHPDDFSVQN